MSNINWILRLKNRTILLALITCAGTFIYQVLGLLGITAPISEDILLQSAGMVLNLLVALGVLVDPTTKGISDSPTALEYTEPN